MSTRTGEFYYGASWIANEGPKHTITRSWSLMAGFIPNCNATCTDEFLSGFGASGSISNGLLGVGINHSYGGDTSLEVGFAPRGVNFSPIGYGGSIRKTTQK
jgi:hypothetical protein